MVWVFCMMFKGFVCIIGVDISGIICVCVGEVFKVLGNYDVVFGFVFDGGYWLVGLK